MCSLRTCPASPVPAGLRPAQSMLPSSSTGNPACPEERRVYPENRRACARVRTQHTRSAQRDIVLFRRRLSYRWSPSGAFAFSNTQPSHSRFSAKAGVHRLFSVNDKAAAGIATVRQNRARFEPDVASNGHGPRLGAPAASVMAGESPCRDQLVVDAPPFTSISTRPRRR
jgi:hypothetical protein